MMHSLKVAASDVRSAGDRPSAAAWGFSFIVRVGADLPSNLNRRVAENIGESLVGSPSLLRQNLSKVTLGPQY